MFLSVRAFGLGGEGGAEVCEARTKEMTASCVGDMTGMGVVLCSCEVKNQQEITPAEAGEEVVPCVIPA